MSNLILNGKEYDVIAKATEKQSANSPFNASLVTTLGEKINKTTARATLQSLSYANDVARVCIEILKKSVLQVPFKIAPLKGSEDKNLTNEIDYVTKLLQYPNTNAPHDTWRKVMEQVMEDLLTVDMGAIEVIRNLKNEITELYVVDGSTIYPNIDKKGLFNEEAAYYQKFEDNNEVSATFTKNDLLIFQDSPQLGKRAGQGKSILSKIVGTIVTTINAMNYNSSYFQSTNVPPSLINLQGASSDEIVRIQEYFTAAVRNNIHTNLFTSASSIDYHQLRPTNQDMQFLELYEKTLEIVVSAFGLSIQDVGSVKNVNKSTSEVQSELSDRRGVKSILSILKEEIDRDLIKDLADNKNPNFAYIEFRWDIEKELSPIEISTINKSNVEARKIEVETGLRTLTEIRLEDYQKEALVEIEEKTEEATEQKSTNEDAIEKAIGDIADTRMEFKDEKKVNYDLLGKTLEVNALRIITKANTLLEDARSRVKEEINSAIASKDAAKAAQITAVGISPLLFEVQSAMRNVANVSTTEAQREVNAINTDTVIQDEVLNTQAETNSTEAVNKVNSQIQNLATQGVAVSMTNDQISGGVDQIIDTAKKTTIPLLAVQGLVTTMNNSRFQVFRSNEEDIIGYRYSAVMDSRTSEYCSSMDGKVFKVNDPMLSVITPPNHFQCRSILVPILASETDSIDYVDRPVRGNASLTNFEDGNAFEPTRKERAVEILNKNDMWNITLDDKEQATKNIWNARLEKISKVEDIEQKKTLIMSLYKTLPPTPEAEAVKGTIDTLANYGMLPKGIKRFTKSAGNIEELNKDTESEIDVLLTEINKLNELIDG